MTTLALVINKNSMSDDTEYVFCGGNFDPNDHSHHSRIVAVDHEIIGWLERQARRKRKRALSARGSERRTWGLVV
jgi:hypothetical protein